MPAHIISAGDRYGRLVVCSEVESVVSTRGKRTRRFVCTCECGKSKTVRMDSLRSGDTKSCGCLQREATRSSNTKHGMSVRSSRHPLYDIWKGMLRRCENKSDKRYKDYGGRGISVCNEWREDCRLFIQWAISSGWARGLHIDREDNNGDYSPRNCRFVSSLVNNRNARSNMMISFNGKTACVSEWAEITGIPRSTIRYRIIHGWSIGRALARSTVKYSETKEGTDGEA